jgi:hypothetical protein
MSTFNHNDKFFITSGGNVVINGQSTDGYFEIRQTDNTPSIRLNNGSNPNGAYYDILSNTAGSLVLNRNGSLLTTLSDTSGNATFAGGVGVGGITPGAGGGYATLVANGTSALPVLALRSSSGKVRLGFYEGGAGRFYIDTLNGANGINFVDGDGSTVALGIDASQNATFEGDVIAANRLLRIRNTTNDATGINNVVNYLYFDATDDNDNNRSTGLIQTTSESAFSSSVLATIDSSMQFFVSENNFLVKWLDVASDKTAAFAGTVEVNNMLTIDIDDISTGENKGLKLLNSNGVDQQWNITAGQTGVDNDKFTIRDATYNIDALTLAVNSGNATFAGNVDLDSDSAKLRLGDGQDLSIYYNGTNGFITYGTSGLYIQGDFPRIQSSAGEVEVL